MTWKFRDALDVNPKGKEVFWLLWQESPREGSAYKCIDGLAKENCTIEHHIQLFTTKITWWSGCLSLNILKYNMFSIPFSLIMTLLLSNACLWTFRHDQSDENIDWSAWATWPLRTGRRGVSFFTDPSGSQELERMQRQRWYVYYTHPCVVPYLLRNVIVVTKMIPFGLDSILFLSTS